MQTMRRSLHADMDTPVSAYLKLAAGEPWACLFESVEGREVWAAYSIIGIGAQRTFRAEHGRLVGTDAGPHDPLAALRAVWQQRPKVPAGAPAFVGGLFGYVSYDAVRAFEALPDVATAAEVPDLCFFEPELLAVFDNRRHTLDLYSTSAQRIDDAMARLRAPVPRLASSGRKAAVPHALVDAQAFEHAVAQAKEHIVAGDIIQVVLSRPFELPTIAAPFDVYRGLRTINPSPYMFYVRTPELAIAGASPEVMVRVQAREMIVRPIAGTRPRGATSEADAALAVDLLADSKERAEHIMLVDLGRNDVGRVCQAGSVRVTELMSIERYSHVMHIVSEVRGQLRGDADAFDALRAAFPAGTLSGAPKVRAMQIIDQLEQRRRGIYGGAVGYFGPNGQADFGIAIRTLVAHPDRMLIQAGAGIVADSDPVAEREETEHKAAAVLRAAAWASSSEAAY